MIEGLKAWLLGVIAAAMVLAVAYALVPKGAVRAIAKVTGGLTLFLVLVRPVIGVNLDQLKFRYEDYAEQIDTQIAQYREENRMQMEEIIERQTGAYISEKAEKWGVICSVRVEAQMRDGVPVPSSVYMDTVRHEALSQWITQELGIGETQQHWEVGD